MHYTPCCLALLARPCIFTSLLHGTCSDAATLQVAAGLFGKLCNLTPSREARPALQALLGRQEEPLTFLAAALSQPDIATQVCGLANPVWSESSRMLCLPCTQQQVGAYGC